MAKIMQIQFNATGAKPGYRQLDQAGNLPLQALSNLKHGSVGAALAPDARAPFQDSSSPPSIAHQGGRTIGLNLDVTV